LDDPKSRPPTATTANSLHRIVVVGGGAGGLELVTSLGEKFGRTHQAHVTLIEKARTHLWKPLLHSVAAGSLDRSQHELNYLAQAHWHHFNYRYGEMIGLDRAAKEIHLAATIDDEGRTITPPSSIGYDTLIMAIGSITNDFGTQGAAAHAIPLETPDQATRFHRRLVNACLRANTQTGPVRPGQLDVAIIGAGATGTELAAELHRTVRAVVAYGLTNIEPERDIHLVLIEAAPRILPALPERISNATLALLGEIGVNVRTNARVSEVRADGVCLADGSFIPSELVVWSAGVKAPDFLKDMGGLETNHINRLRRLPTRWLYRANPAAGPGRASDGIAPRQADAKPPGRKTDRTIQISRFWFIGLARAPQHGRQPDGFHRRKEHVHRRHLRSYHVPIAV
jgi:NADH dehydrogenase